MTKPKLDIQTLEYVIHLIECKADAYESMRVKCKEIDNHDGAELWHAKYNTAIALKRSIEFLILKQQEVAA